MSNNRLILEFFKENLTVIFIFIFRLFTFMIDLSGKPIYETMFGDTKPIEVDSPVSFKKCLIKQKHLNGSFQEDVYRNSENLKFFYFTSKFPFFSNFLFGITCERPIHWNLEFKVKESIPFGSDLEGIDEFGMARNPETYKEIVSTIKYCDDKKGSSFREACMFIFKNKGTIHNIIQELGYYRDNDFVGTLSEAMINIFQYGVKKDPEANINLDFFQRGSSRLIKISHNSVGFDYKNIVSKMELGEKYWSNKGCGFRNFQEEGILVGFEDEGKSISLGNNNFKI